MTFPNTNFMQNCKKLAVFVALAISFSPKAGAFPPAPYYSIYGDVRDEWGDLIDPRVGRVVLLKGEETIMTAPLSDGRGADFNYQLRVRMDQLLGNTASYNSEALKEGDIYSLRIEYGGAVYYPIEMSRPEAIGAPGDRRRIDLTIGPDKDLDGLPDAWEEWMLYEQGEGGNLPGPNGFDLSLIDRDGDFDRDGKSNYLEYLAGTYATNATGDNSTLELKIKEKLPEAVRLEFYAMFGKEYSLQSSTDLKKWEAASFFLAPPPTSGPSTFYTKSAGGITSLYTAATSEATFYRLQIR